MGSTPKESTALDCTKVEGFYAVAMNEGKPYTLGALARLVKGTGCFFWNKAGRRGAHSVAC